MRNAFADELTRLGHDPRLVMLSGDIGNRLFDKFRAAHPGRFFNCGVAEQNMMGMATGLAMSGLRPFAYTIAPFVTTRCLEQIRTDACYHDVPVTIVSVGAGLSYAGLGPSHHSCEDIAFLRAIPNLIVLCPGDAFEVRACMRAVLKQDRPAYIRMGKKGEKTVHKSVPEDFTIGRAIVMREGVQACLLSTGNMLPEVMEAAEILAEQGISAQVVSFHTVKPLDVDFLRDAVATFPLVATIEEHSLIGGLGSAVAEWCVDHESMPRKFLRFGTPDRFYKEAGEQEYAREVLNISKHHIAERVATGLGSVRNSL
jgi:transketolase